MKPNHQMFDNQMVLESIIMCSIIDKLHMRSEGGWVAGGTVGQEFYKCIAGMDIAKRRRRRFRDARESAVAYGWIEHGQRTRSKAKLAIVEDVGRGTPISESEKDGKSSKQVSMPWEDGMRLTPSGNDLVERQKSLDVRTDNIQDSSPRIVYIKNIPTCVTIQDLAEYLDSVHGCIIVAARQKKRNANGGYWLAHAKTESALDAEMLIVLSNLSKLFLYERRLEVSENSSQTLQLPPIERKEEALGNMAVSDTSTLRGTTSATSDATVVVSKKGNAKEKGPTLRFIEDGMVSTSAPEEVDFKSKNEIAKQDDIKGKTVGGMKHSNDRRLFVKNVPTETPIIDLVRYLEKRVRCNILKAKIEEGPHWCSGKGYCFARIEVEKVEESEALIAKSNKLHLEGRVLEIVREKYPETELAGDGSELYKTFFEKGPRTTALDLHLTDHTKLLCICLLQSCSGHIEWRSLSNLGGIFKQNLIGRDSENDANFLASSTTKEFRKAYKAAWENDLVEFGRQKLLEGNERCPNISVVPEGSKNDSGLYSGGAYLRLTRNGYLSAIGASNSSSSDDVLGPKKKKTEIHSEEETVLTHFNDTKVKLHDQTKLEAIVSSSTKGSSKDPHAHNDSKRMGNPLSSHHDTRNEERGEMRLHQDAKKQETIVLSKSKIITFHPTEYLTNEPLGQSGGIGWRIDKPGRGGEKGDDCSIMRSHQPVANSDAGHEKVSKKQLDKLTELGGAQKDVSTFAIKSKRDSYPPRVASRVLVILVQLVLRTIIDLLVLMTIASIIMLWRNEGASTLWCLVDMERCGKA